MKLQTILINLTRITLVNGLHMITAEVWSVAFHYLEAEIFVVNTLSITIFISCCRVNGISSAYFCKQSESGISSICNRDRNRWKTNISKANDNWVSG